MSNDLVNFEKVLDALGHDAELLRDTIQLSLQVIPRYLEQIKEAIDKNDAEELELRAHTLKGSVSIYYYEPAKELAHKLEKMGQNQELAAASETYLALTEKVSDLLANLRAFVGVV